MNNRIHHLDAMRGTLMMLGVFYHSAKVFSTSQDWIIIHPESTLLANFMIEVLHIFRMPAFFILSGYFAALTLKRYGSAKFLKVRVTRIMIPFVVTALTLNSLQAYVLTQTGWVDFNLTTYLLDGNWVTHLWFLMNLVIYFLLYVAIHHLLKEKTDIILNTLNLLLSKVPFAAIMMFLLPISIIAALAIGQIYPVEHILKTSLLFNYMPFFFFGVLTYHHKTILAKFTDFPPLFSFLITVVAVMIAHYFASLDAYIWYIVHVYFISIGMWFSASLCFHLFKKFTSYHSNIFRVLSEMSYTVYLFHHLLVIMIGLVLIHYGIGGTLGLILLIISVAVIAVSIHLFVVSKVKILSLLFNGK